MAEIDFEISATPVTIGRRSLGVRECSFWDLENKVRPFQKKASETGLASAEIFDLFLYFLGHNEGVDREWLERRLPANIARTMEFLFLILEASGLERPKKTSGEAPAQ